jgi:putative secretion ATPase (PEP-CTERM system associated)
MYEKFYGFREKPFQIVPNPAYLYKSPKHEAALTYLEYGVAENVGFILLTGEIGSGKTTLVQYILSRLDASTEAAVVFNTNVSADELLGLILEEFEIPRASQDKAALLNALNQFLIDRYAQRKRVILIIDEAQNLSEKALEEVRMLSNLQSEDQNLLQIMLVGQPELVAKLKQPALRQFAQRIAASYHLTGLDREETGAYIAHRLVKAGGRPELFTSAAVDLIHQLSAGIPRSINLMCQAALVYGFAEGAKSVSQDLIRQIQEDNVGISLAASLPETPGALPHAAAAAESDGIPRRLQELENQLRDMRLRMDMYIQQNEKRAHQSSEELFARLERLLVEERRSSADLLHRCTKLEMENRVLRKYKSILQKLRRGSG